jgi:hypothetical protein
MITPGSFMGVLVAGVQADVKGRPAYGRSLCDP